MLSNKIHFITLKANYVFNNLISCNWSFFYFFYISISFACIIFIYINIYKIKLNKYFKHQGHLAQLVYRHHRLHF
jgi:hypothetical protein